MPESFVSLSSSTTLKLLLLIQLGTVTESYILNTPLPVPPTTRTKPRTSLSSSFHFPPSPPVVVAPSSIKRTTRHGQTQLFLAKGFDSSVSFTASTRLSEDDIKREKTIQGLEQWAKKVGISSKDIKVEAGSKIIGGGLGLLTTKSIPNANSLMLQVPTDLTFSVSSSDLEPNPASEKYFTNKAKVYRSAPWYAKLALDVYICDKISSLRDDDDDENAIEMRPWLNSLPREFSTPIHWNDNQRQQLQYTPLQSMIQTQEKSYKALYNKLKQEITPNSQLDQTNWSYQDFLWGCDTAKSRAFSGAYGGAAFDAKPYALTLLLVVAYVGLGLGSIEQASNGAALVFCGSILRDFVVPKLFKNKKYIICPLIDMANHVGTNEEGNVAFEYFGNGYSLSTTKEMSKGQEVKISYGPRSNDVLLQQYGFVECNNAHDVYVMPPLREWDIQALEEACGRTIQPGRLEKLDRAGLLGGSSLSVGNDDEDDDLSGNRGRGVVISRAAGIDPAIMTALRVLMSSDEEWEASGEAVGNFVTENSGGTKNEKIAIRAAKRALEVELESKESTLEDDEALLERMNSSGNGSTELSTSEQLAVQFRIEKKKLLKETIFSLSLDE